MSIAGGVDRAVDRAVDAGCDTLQIFTKNNQQWVVRPLNDKEIEGFRAKRKQHGLNPVFAHACYLLNLASGDPELWQRSCDVCAVELERSARLGLDGLVLHPGAHRGDGEQKGLERVARGLEQVLDGLPDGPPILLETTAGQGTSLGHRLEHLSWLLQRIGDDQLGICLDTCHLHAAGYALDNSEGVSATLDAIEQTLGLDAVAAVHLNDSKADAGSRRDRHAGIGEGTIGTAVFAALLQDPRLSRKAGMLETPKGDDGELGRLNLARLRALQVAKRSPQRLAP